MRLKAGQTIYSIDQKQLQMYKHRTEISPRVSAFLDRTRWLAALAVMLGHLRVQILQSASQFPADAIFPKILVFFSGFGRGAVIIFFIISGYLVGGGLLTKPKHTKFLKNYLIDRLTRLYVVLIPVLFATWLLAYWQCESGDSCEWQRKYWQISTLFGNLMFQQNIRFENWGGNYPLWSLANEFLYYIAFPLVLIAYREDRIYRWLAVVAMVIVAIAMGWSVLILFPIWLLGVAARQRFCPSIPAWPALMLLISALAFKRLYVVGPLDIYFDYLVGIGFFFMLRSVSDNNKVFTQRPMILALDKWAASWSYTLYAFHVPVLGFITWNFSNKTDALDLPANQPKTWAIYFICFFGTLAICYMFSLLTERNTYKVRRLLTRKFGE